MLDDARMQKLEFMPFMGKSLKKQKKCPILHPYIDIASGVRLMFVCDLTPECCATILSEFYIIDRQGCPSPPLNGGVEPCSSSFK